MKRSSRTIALAALVTCVFGASTAAAAVPEFRYRVSRLSAEQRSAMTPSVWRRGCPVSLGSLRLVAVRRWDFRGRTRVGRVVVHHSVARDTVRIFRRMYVTRFPIRYMTPIERFGGSDFRSIQADNTSAFNCRYVAGTRRWSNHAYGTAIDINPIENPYVTVAGTVSHPASRRYITRIPRRGVLLARGSVVRGFRALGWDWGGLWRGAKDYQHFSKTGG